MKGQVRTLAFLLQCAFTGMAGLEWLVRHLGGAAVVVAVHGRHFAPAGSGFEAVGNARQIGSVGAGLAGRVVFALATVTTVVGAEILAMWDSR